MPPKKNPTPAKKKAPPAPVPEAIVPPAPVEPVAPIEPAAPPAPEPIVIPAAVPPSDKPGMLTTVAVLTLVSGITNILWMLVAGLSMLGAGFVSFGLSCLFLPVVIPPLVLGIFEIVYAAKILPNPIRPTQPSQAIAILEILCILTGNIVPVVTGILALVFYADLNVKAYFAKYGGQA
jgi:hypothetical protein